MIIRATADQGQIVSDRLAREIARYEREKGVALPFRAPSGPAMGAAIAAGDTVLIDDGNRAEYEADRLVVWLHRGQRVIGRRQQPCIFVQHAWGPSALHDRIVATIARRIMDDGDGDVPILYPAGLPIANRPEAMQENQDVIGAVGQVVQVEADGLRRVTARQGIAALRAAGVKPLDEPVVGVDETA